MTCADIAGYQVRGLLWVNRVVAGSCRSLADFRNAPKADAKSGHWHLTRWTRTDVGFVRDCLFVEPQPTCESIQRLTRHIQSIDRRLLIQIAARHPTGHYLLRTEAQLLSNYGLETDERNLWTRCKAADLRGEHQSLQEQTIVKPAVLR